nr:NAD(P)-dependent oxidoreductase [Stackebrandtia nassauensis]
MRNIRWSNGWFEHSVATVHTGSPVRKPTMPTTAILGQGRMGAAMAARLREHDADVRVWNRDPARCEAARAAGATVAASAAEAVTEADLVLVMLADGPAVAEVLAEVVPALGSEAVVVQMSTISPDETRALAAKHHALPLLDAPVKGSVPQVLAGSLAILTAGAKSDVDRARPVLEHLGTIVDCGAIGGGSAAKLVVNAAMIATATVLAQSFALAAQLGLDEAATRELLSQTPLSPALRRYDPDGGDFPVYLAAKDVRLAHESAEGLAVFQAVEAHLNQVAESDAQAGLWTVVRQAVATFE